MKRQLIKLVDELLDMNPELDTEVKKADRKAKLLLMTAQELVQEKHDINRREREAREDKLMQLAKRLDHIERALTLTLTP